MRAPQHVLVTGGAGFIGSSFVRCLLAPDLSFGGRVINLDLLTYAGNLENVASVASDPRYSFVRGSILDEALVERLCQDHGVDTIVNFAAETHVDRSILGPRAFVETNVLGTLTLLEVARRRGAHLHQVSTDEVYGSLGADGLFREDSPYQPSSPYAASKAGADHLVRAYAQTYGASVTLSSCSNNYGPYQFPEKLIPLMIDRCLSGEPLPIYGDGSNVRDWLYVDDHARAVWDIVRRGPSGRTYNIGGGCELTNLEAVQRLADVVAELSGKDPARLREQITFVKDRPGHDRRYAIDASRIEDELGFAPSFSFETGLRATVRWYLENGPWLERVKTGAYREWVEQNYEGR